MNMQLILYSNYSYETTNQYMKDRIKKYKKQKKEK